jgi:hypothetical protein
VVFVRYPQIVPTIPPPVPVEKCGCGRLSRDLRERTIRYKSNIINTLRMFEDVRESAGKDGEVRFWLPPRDSNPDMLIQSQLSCR